VAPSLAKPPLKRTRGDGATTRSLILQSARRRLCEAGYARLSVRDIAKDAEVNHALINYHFQGKQQLVLAVLDDANKKLLERQSRMYSESASAETKWQQACDFYDEDLQSGFVRVLMELMGASFNDETLRREFTPRLLAWTRLVETAVTDFVDSSGLNLPVSTRAIAAWISWFWIGMEASMTLGIAEEDGHQREALAAFAALLRHAEGRVLPQPRKKRERRI
jgi:AcrR family transcriptional regulator